MFFASFFASLFFSADGMIGVGDGDRGGDKSDIAHFIAVVVMWGSKAYHLPQLPNPTLALPSTLQAADVHTTNNNLSSLMWDDWPSNAAALAGAAAISISIVIVHGRFRACSLSGSFFFLCLSLVHKLAHPLYPQHDMTYSHTQ